MSSIDLREVEAFLVLAEELHFGRAAERLFMSPSRMSQTIRALETRVGGRLFDRTSRQVRLTPVGEKLRDRLVPVHAELRQAFDDARDLAAGVVGELRISTLSLCALGTSFDLIRATFHDRYPGCRVFVLEERTSLALVDLRRGNLDLVAAWQPVDQPDLTVGPVLTREERVLLVKVGHPLLAKGEATVEDLGDYAVANFEAALPPETGVSFCPRHTPSGRPIMRRYPARGANDVLSVVAEGAIVHPTVTSFPQHYRHPHVTHVPISGLPSLQSALVWVTARETATIRAFAQIATEIAGEP
jgi:DNA-binding transcriptional LysR family regulator